MGNGTTQWDPQALPYGYLLHRRYRIERVLGKGGFGITYAVTDAQDGQRYAIKELFPSMHVQRGTDHVTVRPYPQNQAGFEQTANSFLKETRMLMKLQDVRDVLRLYHAFSENGTSYYVMEYLDGQTLQKRLKNGGPMDWNTLSAIIQPVIIMLARIHKTGAIHRDVSPDNIMLLRDGRVRLIDFGNVRSFSGMMTAYVKGQFAPWEQFTTVIQQGPYTDVYSLCVTVYYCLTGTLPPKAAERFDKDELVPLRQLKPGLPENLYKAIEHGMAVRVNDRTQDMEALYREIYGRDLNRGTIVQSPPNSGLRGGSGNSPRGVMTLQCRAGCFAGRSWALAPGMTVTIGRDPTCTIVYPGNAPGVSHLQLTITAAPDGSVYVQDVKSSYGTFFVTPRGNMRLALGKWYGVKNNILRFGAQEQYWIG